MPIASGDTDCTLVRPRYFLQKVVCEQGDIAAPFHELRQDDGDDVEAVVEVVPELPLRHGLLKVHVGGRDEPEIHVNRLGPADALETALFNHPEELYLRAERHGIDLVEKERAPGR